MEKIEREGWSKRINNEEMLTMVNESDTVSD